MLRRKDDFSYSPRILAKKMGVHTNTVKAHLRKTGSNLAPQDMLLVSELSRLGRSVAQIIFLIDQMVQQQIRFVAIKEGIELAGSQDIQTKVMVTLFSLFAEIERDL